MSRCPTGLPLTAQEDGSAGEPAEMESISEHLLHAQIENPVLLSMQRRVFIISRRCDFDMAGDTALSLRLPSSCSDECPCDEPVMNLSHTAITKCSAETLL